MMNTTFEGLEMAATMGFSEREIPGACDVESAL
jgi:hypothetical protein